jgi:hypothetical protein
MKKNVREKYAAIQLFWSSPSINANARGKNPSTNKLKHSKVSS